MVNPGYPECTPQSISVLPPAAAEWILKGPGIF